FRVLGMTFDGHRSELVVGPDASRATAERAIATRGLAWRKGKSEAHGSAMAGAVKRWGCLFVTHGSHSSVAAPPGVLHVDRSDEFCPHSSLRGTTQARAARARAIVETSAPTARRPRACRRRPARRSPPGRGARRWRRTR